MEAARWVVRIVLIAVIAVAVVPVAFLLAVISCAWDWAHGDPQDANYS